MTISLGFGGGELEIGAAGARTQGECQNRACRNPSLRRTHEE
jgi:hypothetical protein